MPDPLRKADFHCPHCGFVQHESAHLISTYCRSCGSHYEVGSAAVTATGQAESGKSPGGFMDRTFRRQARPPREIRCHHCGLTHEVSHHAKNTICAGCNASIDLSDLVFSSHVSRPVNTRGRLIITSGGCLNTALAVCGDALIEGKINGTLHCEGTLRIASSEKLSCRITARAVVIEKGIQVEITLPVTTADLVVRGQTIGNFTCDGRVLISKRGALEGRLTARSVVVERGGSLLALSAIQPKSGS